MVQTILSNLTVISWFFCSRKLSFLSEKSKRKQMEQSFVRGRKGQEKKKKKKKNQTFALIFVFQVTNFQVFKIFFMKFHDFFFMLYKIWWYLKLVISFDS